MSVPSEPRPAPAAPLTRAHRTRLMQLWRSAGWPCHDLLELDLLAAGLLERVPDGGRDTLRVSDAGVAWLAAGRTRRADSAHDQLAARVADGLVASGRLVWRELSLRAVADAVPAVPGAPDLWDEPSAAPTRAVWRMARPDVFSVRTTSVEDYLHPWVHEVKVSRADLLSDLRHEAKRASYRWLCCECHYVFPAGIAEPQEIPEPFGVWLLHGDLATGRIEVARPARHTACRLPFPVWMALARSTPERPTDDDEPQARLAPG